MNGSYRSRVSNAQRLYLTQPGNETALLAELKRGFPHSKHVELYSGIVRSDIGHQDLSRNPSLAFASQALAAVEEVSAATVSRWVQLLAERVMRALDGVENPWRLHVFPIQSQDGYVGERRCELIEQELLAHLERKQRRLLKTLRENCYGWWDPDEVFVQLGLLTVDRGFVSCIGGDERARVQGGLSILPSGFIKIRDDKRPPSRAYRKLLEAQAHLDLRIERGHRCVDLGASPGGWTWVAIEQGASVLAVDRAPLREDLMANPLVQFQQGDGFAYEPVEKVDWLLCDIVAFPERSIELIDRWIRKKLCRALVVTVKFRGSEDYEQLDTLKDFLRLASERVVIRHLTNNKNEVTVIAQLEQLPMSSTSAVSSAG